MRIDICIPAYNEEKIIAEAVYSVSEALSLIPNITWRVIVSENGSVDNTAQYARTAGAYVISTSESGKGGAIIAAARVSQADIFGFIDADLSADPTYIAILLKEIYKGADIAIGSRLLKKEETSRSIFRTVTSIMFNMLRKSLLGVRVSDAQCGLKLMIHEVVSWFCNAKKMDGFWTVSCWRVLNGLGLSLKKFKLDGRSITLKVA